MTPEDESRYKDEVLKNFSMAEGAMLYGNRTMATVLVRDAYKICTLFLDPEWWSGEESTLFLAVQFNCPNLVRMWRAGEL